MVNAKALIAYIVILVVVIAIWGISTGFALPHFGSSTTTTTTSSTTSATSTTASTSTTSSTTSIYVSYCNNFFQYLTTTNSTIVDDCTWAGGKLGVWVAAGPATTETVKIVGISDNVTYVNQTDPYPCTTFYSNFTAPAQMYQVFLTTSNQVNSSSQCKFASVKLNTTLTAPVEVYNNVFNGNFSTGTYAGWTLTGNGFGAAPLNLSYANTAINVSCYTSTKWKNFNDTFTATTFNCGISVAPGNLTSSLFYAKKPFLNFRIVSPQNNYLYVEILYANNTPAIVAHYNTFNITSSRGNASSTFVNASIPLVTVLNKEIKVRVVANTLNRLTFIAVQGFSLASTPKQDSGVLYGSYNFSP